MKTLFISDIHLDPKQPEIQNCFDLFVDHCIKHTNEIDALYILGDLFEVWIGDDASIPIYQHTIEQLKNLSSSGIKLFVMHGNRDFLLGSEFSKITGSTIIPDPYILNINHENILLSHGDSFCIDDKEYMQFREMVRNSDWQRNFLSKSIDERIEIAQQMRKVSQEKGQDHYEIMDVNQQEIETIMLEHNIYTLIHGHTHKPNTHNFMINSQTAKRIVLPDWTPDAQALVL